MNAKTLIAAAALAIVGTTAFADEVRDYPTPSTLTRAEVKAELARARADQSLDSVRTAEAYGNVQPMILAQRAANGPVTTLTRVEVKRQLDQARADGSVQVAGEAYGSVQPGKSLRSREEVRAEAIAANRAHRYGYAADHTGN